MNEQVVYRFENPAAFPVLEHPGPDSAEWSLSAVTEGRQRLIVVRMRMHAVSAGGHRFVLGLPPRSLIGTIEGFALNVRGDGSHCRIALAAADPSNNRCLFEFDPVAFLGWGRCETRRVRWYDPEDTEDRALKADLSSPMQPYQLILTTSPATQCFSIGLGALAVRGVVRKAASGIALS